MIAAIDGNGALTHLSMFADEDGNLTPMPAADTIGGVGIVRGVDQR